MTKRESRLVREVKTHCRFSDNGYLTIRDKRRFPLIDKMLGKGLLNISNYSSSHRSISLFLEDSNSACRLTPQRNYQERITIDESIIVKIENDQLKKALNEALKFIPERHRLAVEHRYGLNGNSPKTLQEVAEILGVTKERVRQIVCRSERRLRGSGRNIKLHEFRAITPYTGTERVSKILKIKKYRTELNSTMTEMFGIVEKGFVKDYSDKNYIKYNTLFSHKNYYEIAIKREEEDLEEITRLMGES